MHQRTFTDQHNRVWVDTKEMSLCARLSIPTLDKYRREGRLHQGDHWIQSATSNRKVYFCRDAVLNHLKNIKQQRSQQQRVHMAQVRDNQVCCKICPDTRAGIELIRQDRSWTKITEEKIGDVVLSTNEEQMAFTKLASILLERAVKNELERLELGRHSA